MRGVAGMGGLLMASTFTFTLPPDVAEYLAAIRPGEKSGKVAEAIRQSEGYQEWQAREVA